jgi:hypothetical protein
MSRAYLWVGCVAQPQRERTAITARFAFTVTTMRPLLPP